MREEEEEKMGEQFRQIMAAVLAILAASGKKRIFCSWLPIQLFGHFIELLAERLEGAKRKVGLKILPRGVLCHEKLCLKLAKKFFLLAIGRE